ncbi:hypothetical protein [Spongiimicrobium salis]|uniref:hypothetical protein n=1 Tax=Spongiimicrobium salis TaxID=1667022 RepID=UPI00374D0A83
MQFIDYYIQNYSYSLFSTIEHYTDFNLTLLENTPFYKEAFNELTFPFGKFYLFDTFVISEINEGILMNWDDHGKLVAEELSHLYDHNGANLIYISNRVHAYSVKPADWIKFFRFGYQIKGYGIINYNRKGYPNGLLEKLFIPSKVQRFSSLEKAIQWARNLSSVEMHIS